MTTPVVATEALRCACRAAVESLPYSGRTVTRLSQALIRHADER